MGPRQKEDTLRAFQQWGFDQRGWSPTTRKNYANHVRRADQWLHDNLGANVVWAKPADLRKYLFQTKPTAWYRNNIRQALVAFGEFMIAQEWTQVNNASGLPTLPVQRPLPKALDEEQCRRITVISKTLSPRDRALILVFLYSGLRATEARTLRWDCVGDGFDWIRFVGKGSKEREIPLHPEVIDALRQLRHDGLDAVYCFPSPMYQGRPVSEASVRRLVVGVGIAAGIPGLHPHMLRHSFATALMTRGIPIEVAQELLGHADISTTRIYRRVRPTNLREAVARLDFSRVQQGASGEHAQE